jgi:Galactose oxidase, central domain/Dockerin type I domain/Kelch motif
MNLLTQSKNTTILPVLIALMLGCFGLLPAARAVDPPPDGGYPTAEGEDGVLSLNTPASGSWTATGSLHTARNKHTATLLQNGMVLVAGGIGSLGVHLTSAELYDPASGTWTATGSMGTARCEHTATLLPSGKVLVAGGYNGPALSSAELYDPASGTWTATGSMRDERGEHTATLLPSGKVLVVGGFDLSSAWRSGELYDPVTGTWTATGSLGTARYDHTATLLPNGQMLVASGTGSDFRPLRSAELYDPTSGTWTATGSLVAARGRHTATLLPNDKVLVTGGFNGLSSAELYDPASGTWSATGSMGTARFVHTATLLPNGEVLVAAGYNFDDGYLSSAELYDPASGTWTATGSMGTARGEHTATLLPNGKVLVAGGSNGVPLSSAELYVSDGGGGLTLDSASSIQRGFAIDLPLSGPSGVEDRSGGPNKKFYVAMTFNNNITSVGSATTTCGGVSTWSISGSTVTFNLVGVAHGCNESDITITANDVMDDMGNTLTSASVAMGLLLGDVNGDRVVDGFDRRIVRSYLGQHTDGTNYRSDVSNDGFINHSDKQLVEQQQGTSLP